jgi:hypothetical protein
LNSNLFVINKTVLKKKNVFLFEFSFWAESSAPPSRPPRAHAAYAAQRLTGVHRVAKLNPTGQAESDPIAPDLTR